MNKKDEDTIKAILCKHLDAATNEMCDTDVDCGYWTDNCVPRLAEICVQFIANQAESCEVADKIAAQQLED